MRILLFAVLVFLLLGSTGTVFYYPDGPFTVNLNYQGRNIAVIGEVTLHSETVVSERRSGSSYSKTAGSTSYSDFSIVTETTNANLDSWFTEGTEAEPADFYLSIQNGRHQITEGWKIYNVKPVRREVQDDGSVQYTFRPTLLERDLDITSPVQP